MSYKGYDDKIDPLCPVAVKVGQTVIHALSHDTWGIVTCDKCQEKFFIGPNHIYGSRIGDQECAKRLEARLGEDHKLNRPHQDSYEIRD